VTRNEAGPRAGLVAPALVALALVAAAVAVVVLASARNDGATGIEVPPLPESAASLAPRPTTRVPQVVAGGTFRFGDGRSSWWAPAGRRAAAAP